MSTLNKSIKAMIIGGAFFVMPLLIVVFVIKKAVEIILPVVKNVLVTLGMHGLLGVMTISLISIGVLLLAGYISGYLITKGIINKGPTALEKKLFQVLPGLQIWKYRFMDEKELAVGKYWKGILLKEDNAFRPAFITDESDPVFFSIYIPDAPNIDAGEVRFVPKETCEYQLVTIKQAIKMMRHIGQNINVSELIKPEANK